MFFKNLGKLGSVLLAAILFGAVTQAAALDLNFKGSLGEGGHKRYVPAVSNPLFNETPYITTELRPMWLHQPIPGTVAGLPVGGTINLLAMQARVALTDRLGIIATKDGYADIDFDQTLRDDDGFANIALGLKYAVLNRPDEDAIVTVGLTYEPPSGNLIEGVTGTRLQGGRSDGFMNMFVSGSKTFGDWNLQANVGYNQAVDTDVDTSMFHIGTHTDLEIYKDLFPFLEWNVYAVVDDATRTPALPIEGTDIVNLGSTSAGTVATVAGGFRYKIMDHLMMGWAYEVPMTNREDLFDWRSTLDFVIYY